MDPVDSMRTCTRNELSINTPIGSSTFEFLRLASGVISLIFCCLLVCLFTQITLKLVKQKMVTYNSIYVAAVYSERTSDEYNVSYFFNGNKTLKLIHSPTNNLSNQLFVANS